MAHLRLIICVALLAVAPRAASPDGEPPKNVDPFKTFREICKSLPAPTKEAAFTFDGVRTYLGYPHTSYWFEVKPHQYGDVMAWRCEERIHQAPEAPRRRIDWAVRTTAYLSQDFRLLHAKTRWTGPDGFSTATWNATEDGIALFRSSSSPESEKEPDVVPVKEPVLFGLLSHILFVRIAPPQKLSIRVPSLDFGSPIDPESRLHARLIEPPRDERWRSLPAVHVRMGAWTGKSEFDLVLSAKDRSVRALRVLDSGYVRHEVVPRADAKALAAPEILTAPPQTPEAAAVQTLLVMSRKDEVHFERLVHWPSVLEHRRKDGGVADLDEAAVRKTCLEAFRRASHRTPWPPHLTEVVLRGIVHEMRVRKESADRAIVGMPPGLGSLHLYVVRTGETWRLSRPPPNEWPRR